MLFSHKDKIKLKNYLLKNLIKIEGVLSVTLVGSFWEKNNLNNFTFIDFGCGYSRSLFFLKKFFNLKFIGIDLNKRIIKKMQNFKSHKSFFFDCVYLLFITF
mgnify:CR=1 FL=1